MAISKPAILSHQIPRIHHVRSGPDQAAYDLIFLIAGALLVIGGGLLARTATERRAIERSI